MDVTDNVVDLLTQNLARLNETTIEALKAGSCRGNRFSIDDLSLIMEKDPVDCAAAIDEAVGVGFVLPLNTRSWSFRSLPEETLRQTEFAFQHDRIEQAVYGLIPEEDRNRVHLAIGMTDDSVTSMKDELQKNVFEVANQVNSGISFLTDNDDKQRIASLNASAALKARESGAYHQALKVCAGQG